MARDNQSLVTLTPPTWNQTVSWTSAATSRGTKKIRRMVSAFGIFIAQTNYIKSVTAASHLWGSRSWLQGALWAAFSRRRGRETLARPAKGRLKGGCRQDCPPHTGGVLYLYFAHESIAPPFLLRQSCTAHSRRCQAAGGTTQCPADPGGRTALLDTGLLWQPGSAHAPHRPAGEDRNALPAPLP